MLNPLPGVSSQLVLAALREIEADVMNLRGSGGTAYERFDAYRRWADEAAGRLAGLVPADWVIRLITSPRYWTAQTIDQTARSLPALAAFVDVELDERLRCLQTAREDVDRQITRWRARNGLLVVPDTNVYLHHADYFDEVEWHTLVRSRAEDVHLIVPLLVVDELDDRKRSARNVLVSDTNSEPVRTRARVTLRKLDDYLDSPGWMATIKPSRFPEAGCVHEW